MARRRKARVYVGQEYSVKEFFEDHREDLDLETVSEDLSSPVPITGPDIHRPAFALTGFMENYLSTGYRS